MWPNPQEIAGLAIFTEKIPNGKLLFCAVDDVAETGRKFQKNLIFHQNGNDGDIWYYLGWSVDA